MKLQKLIRQARRTASCSAFICDFLSILRFLSALKPSGCPDEHEAGRRAFDSAFAALPPFKGVNFPF